MVDFPWLCYVSFREGRYENIPNLNLDILHTTWDLKREGVKRIPKIEGKFSPGVGLHLHPLTGLLTKMNQSGYVRFVLGPRG